MFDRKGLVVKIQILFWVEDPRALVSIEHNCWERLQGVANASILSYINHALAKAIG